MSTKTTLKRLALVTVAALGLGVVSSVAPATAATSFNATYTAPSVYETQAALVGSGGTVANVGSITVNLATLNTALTAGTDSATVSIAAATGADSTAQGKNDAFLAALSLSKTVSGTTASNLDTAGTGYNALNNGTVTLDGPNPLSVSVTPTAGSYSVSSGRAHLNVNRALLATTHSGGVVTVTLTVSSAGLIQTYASTITLTIGTKAGTATTAVTTGTVAPGGTVTATHTQPYTNVPANEAVTATWDLTDTIATANGEPTFSVTAVVTGGSATLVRTTATRITATLLKNALTGSMSVTYTLTATVPATAAAGETVSVGSWMWTVQPYTPTYSYSTASLAVGSNGYYEVTGDGILWGSAAIAAGKSADVTILQKDQNAATITAAAFAKTVTATITGKGSLDAVSGADVVVKTKSWSVANSSLTSGTTVVSVYPEGVSGEGTLSISVNGVAVKSYTMRFFGDATEVTATLLRPVGSTLGAVNGVDGSATSVTNNLAAGTTSSVTATTAAAVAVVVKDANGYAIPTASAPIATSSNLTVVSSAARLFIDSGISDAEDAEFSAGTFVQHYSYTTVAGSTSGASSDLTFTYVNAAGTALVSPVVKAKVGGVLAKTVMTLDKATYAPGSVARLTVTGTDAAGNAAYDGIDVIAGGVESTLAFTAPTSMKLKDGTKYADVFAPASPGTWTITAYDAAGREFTASATISNLAAEAKAAGEAATAAAEAATDAASEATDAANAATDAANAAAEAADAATAAAQDSADAVAALSTQVSEMVAALKKQITALTNLVIKIQKKVKA